MLVLSRKLGESIRIGSNIVVKIASVTRNGVRLAIDAPLEIPVDRSEVRERRMQVTDSPSAIGCSMEQLGERSIGTILVAPR